VSARAIADLPKVMAGIRAVLADCGITGDGGWGDDVLRLGVILGLENLGYLVDRGDGNGAYSVRDESRQQAKDAGLIPADLPAPPVRMAVAS
jgi:hypothetical protein